METVRIRSRACEAQSWEVPPDQSEADSHSGHSGRRQLRERDCHSVDNAGPSNLTRTFRRLPKLSQCPVPLEPFRVLPEAVAPKYLSRRVSAEGCWQGRQQNHHQNRNCSYLNPASRSIQVLQMVDSDLLQCDSLRESRKVGWETRLWLDMRDRWHRRYRITWQRHHRVKSVVVVAAAAAAAADGGGGQAVCERPMAVADFGHVGLAAQLAVQDVGTAREPADQE